MNAKQLIANFDRVSEAPAAPARLRQFVIDLAVAGSLVEHSGKDVPLDPALLEGRRLLGKQPAGRTGGNLGPVQLDEVGLSLPPTWRWARMHQICEPGASIVYGILQPGPDLRPSGVPYVRPSEIKEGRIDLPYVRHTSEEIASKYERSTIQKGDVLLTIVGTLGATAIVPASLDGANITQSSCRLRVDQHLARKEFVVAALKSAWLKSQIQRMKLGTAVPRLNIAHVRALAIPLPPLAEQDRILAKLDELMALCDELEQAQETRERRRDRLATSSQRRMIEATSDPETFRTSAGFYLQRLPRLATRPEHISELRRAILDLALRGELTEHSADSDVGPWLAELRKERAGSEIGLKRSRAKIADEPLDPPYGLAKGWAWVRFGAIHELVRGVSYSGSDASKTPGSGHLPLLRANNIGTTLNFDNLVFVRKERVGTEQRLRRGDYLIALSSGSKNLVGKAAFVPDDYEAAFGAFCGVIRLMSPSLGPYIGLFLASSLYREAIAASSRGIGINNLKRDSLNNLAFPLPPLDEQKLIVAKVEQLITVCDALEGELREGSSKRSRLLDAVLHEALTVT